MKNPPRCASCNHKICREGVDCFELADIARDMYLNEKLSSLHAAATAIEGRHYCKENRLSELILFAKEMKFCRIGLAFCVGLSSEAEIIAEILSKHFEVISVCCKICGINKKEFGLQQIQNDREEVMCNPAGQAEILNNAGSELNVICGLCVGHDAIFSMHSKAPVTTLIAKDRVLGHNPVAAVYCQYIKRSFE